LEPTSHITGERVKAGVRLGGSKAAKARCDKEEEKENEKEQSKEEDVGNPRGRRGIGRGGIHRIKVKLSF
jgi:hypothetical protein